MHGYFIDMRLYRKAKSVVEPYSLNTLKQQKVKEKIEQERQSRIQIKVRKIKCWNQIFSLITSTSSFSYIMSSYLTALFRWSICLETSTS